MKIYINLILLSVVTIVLSSCHNHSHKSLEMNHQYTNQLIDENSPYLLQHAHNPVDWQAWNEAALAQAKAEDKMMIISIGYSACHWCHVMEHESFEDSTVAALMNEHFVTIKVDREERPDIDDVYMAACQLSSGRGCGWPLNAFALPGGRPVWAGTYFPKEQWMDILNQFIKLKLNNPDQLEKFAKNLEEGYLQLEAVDLNPSNTNLLSIDLEKTMEIFKSKIDPHFGGRKGAPKFPMPNNYEMLLKWADQNNDEDARSLAFTTMDRMAESGIFDAVSGGFARYATDDQWKIPHFEKMLYDNGQLLDLYSQGYKISKSPLYKKTINKTVNWITEEMIDESGGIYSALDADSEGEEGKYYIWTYDELASLLGENQDFEIFKDRYQITRTGNWEHGNNIIHTKVPTSRLATKFKLDEEAIELSLESSLAKLKPVRHKRVHPGLDDKILTSWNALVTHGLIEAYFATGNKDALEIATNNIEFLLKNQLQENGQLWRNYKNGRSTINGFFDDYALVIRALIQYYKLTFDEQYLFTAQKITEFAMVHFSDEKSGLFYYTSDLDPPLVTRKRELSDNVIPASNSIMARNLFYLGLYLYKAEYISRAEKMFAGMKKAVIDSKQPTFYSNWIQALIDLRTHPYEVAIVGPDSEKLAMEWNGHYIPNTILLGGNDEGQLQLLKDKLQDDATMIYVCQNKVCKFPVETVEEAMKLVE